MDVGTCAMDASAYTVHGLASTVHGRRYRRETLLLAHADHKLYAQLRTYRHDELNSPDGESSDDEVQRTALVRRVRSPLTATAAIPLGTKRRSFALTRGAGPDCGDDDVVDHRGDYNDDDDDVGDEEVGTMDGGEESCSGHATVDRQVNDAISLRNALEEQLSILTDAVENIRLQLASSTARSVGSPPSRVCEQVSEVDGDARRSTALNESSTVSKPPLSNSFALPSLTATAMKDLSPSMARKTQSLPRGMTGFSQYNRAISTPPSRRRLTERPIDRLDSAASDTLLDLHHAMNRPAIPEVSDTDTHAGSPEKSRRGSMLLFLVAVCLSSISCCVFLVGPDKPLQKISPTLTCFGCRQGRKYFVLQLFLHHGVRGQAWAKNTF